jgi:predicted DNA-binding transcriptional regulator AlpA
MSKTAKNYAPTPELPSFVGYAEVAKSFNVTTKTIRRWQESGHFPKAVHIGPNTRGWPLSVVMDHAAKIKRSLIEAAVETPAEIQPDQLSEALTTIAERLTGIPARDVLGVTRKLSDAETATLEAARRQQAASIYAELIKRSSDLHPNDAIALSRALLPQLAPMFDFMLKAGGTDARLTQEQWLVSIEPILADLLSGL